MKWQVNSQLEATENTGLFAIGM